MVNMIFNPLTSQHFLHIIFFDMNKSKRKINKLTARKFQLTELVFSEFMSIEAKKLSRTCEITITFLKSTYVEQLQH